MGRRGVIVFIFSWLLLLGACEQAASPPAPRLIGLVQLTAVDDNTMNGFVEEMARRGYHEGAEVTYQRSGPLGSAEQVEQFVKALLEKKPALIVVASTPATRAVKRLTEAGHSLPVVFAPVNDPLASGIVSDLRRPGRHITGIRLPTGDDLRLQWLKRLVPGLKRIYLPYTADDMSAQASFDHARRAAQMLGLDLHAQAVSVEGGVAEAIARLPRDAQAIFLPRDSRLEAGIAEFVTLARARRLPISAPSLRQVEAGALFSYGFVHKEIGAQAARLADQILRGIPAGDLPVEMAENRLAIHLGTAADLGLEIPNDIMSHAEILIRP